MTESVNIQREKIQKGNPKIQLARSCRIDQGITKLSPQEISVAVRQFDLLKDDKQICFFIPASGSGSRMFSFLFDYLNAAGPDPETLKSVEHLVRGIPDLAIYHLLTEEMKSQVKQGEIHVGDLINTLLFSEPFNFSTKPKGLVPFHSYEGVVATPFEEHICTGIEIGGNKSSFHFTVPDEYKSEIKACIENFRTRLNKNFDFELSVQDPETNSIAFGENMTPIKQEDGEIVTRPSGHGALIHNLNSVSADLIFIRNIDNIQHRAQSEPSVRYRKALAGELLSLQTAIHKLLRSIDSGENVHMEAQQVNDRYDLGIGIETLANTERLHSFLNRPIRICGVVRNEGQAGGGPFWVIDSAGNLSRQIIEKAQILNEPSQIDHLMNSTHFNPVEIVCAVKDYKGKKFNLLEYRNSDLYFIVHKKLQDRDIRYIEQPGLWNGAMEKWLTLFYEIDSACFSPVKSVLDLLSPGHMK